jgi:glycosyltransferase involved in cell wall biosynthesis
MVKYSFVICNYNMGESLTESFDSLIEQLPDDSEVVVVDGGSTDESKEILEHYDERYDFFSFTVNEEGTLGHDRNLGSELTDGEVLFHQFDCDERLKDGAIEKLLEKWEEILEDSEKEPVAIIGGIRAGYRDVFLDLKYGEVNRAEDRELGRRVKQSEDYVNVVVGMDIVEDIYRPPRMVEMRKHWIAIYSEFVNGLSFRDVLDEFVLDHDAISRKSKLYHAVFVVVNYFRFRLNQFFGEIRSFLSM